MLFLAGAILALLIVVVALIAIGSAAIVFGLLAVLSVVVFYAGGFLASALFGDRFAMLPGGAVAVLILWAALGAYWASKDPQERKE